MTTTGPTPDPAADVTTDETAGAPVEAAPPAGRTRRSRRTLIKQAVQALVVVAFVGFGAWALVDRWTEVRGVLGQMSVVAVVLASAAAFAGIWASFLCWRAVLADLIHRERPVPLTGGMRVFFVGQAGKYVPGAVWPVLTQARLGREYDVPARASSAAAAIFMLMVLGTGLLVGAVCLPVLGPGSFEDYWWTLLVLPVAALLLWPPLLNALMDRALKLARRQPMPRPLSLGGVARGVGWCLVMWLLYGVHLWVLLRDLGASDPMLPLVATGAFAASWSIGFLLLIAPAGAGPREVALVLMLGGVMAHAPATVAALVSRLVMTVGDLAWCGVAVVVERWRKRVAARRSSPVPHP